jgi:type IX secretion system PorP/SprF family membrane protein
LYAHNFYFGFSVSNLFQSSFNTPISNSSFPNTEIRNYYTIGAYKFNIINNDWQLETSFLVRKTKNQSNMTDISVRVLYLTDSWASLGYRTNGSAVLAFGFRANNIFLSYSYDHMFLSEITPNTYGTHELAITFRLKTLSSMRHISFWEN